MLHRITVLPQKQNIDAAAGENLLTCLRAAELAPNAPCGGAGRCGKCAVMVDGREVLACQTVIDRDMTVTLPAARLENILTDSFTQQETSSLLHRVVRAHGFHGLVPEEQVQKR